MLLSGWTPLVFLFASLSVPLLILSGLFQAHQLQLISLLPSYSIVFSHSIIIIIIIARLGRFSQLCYLFIIINIILLGSFYTISY